MPCPRLVLAFLIGLGACGSHEQRAPIATTPQAPVAAVAIDAGVADATGPAPDVVEAAPREPALLPEAPRLPPPRRRPPVEPPRMSVADEARSLARMRRLEREVCACGEVECVERAMAAAHADLAPLSSMSASPDGARRLDAIRARLATCMGKFVESGD
jgi:hypothetical protein